MYKNAFLISSLFAAVQGQGIGTNTAEVHPSLTWQTCTAKNQCSTRNGKVVLDANWRWVHQSGTYTNCYNGNSWNSQICPNGQTCAANCVLEGADYPGTYGVTASGNNLKLGFVTNNANGKNVGSRTYLMRDDNNYEMLKLLNQEFTFDVDVSKLPCGLNGALYLVGMDQDGGLAKYPGNKAGAKYGTGYCDSQCPRDIKFIAGKANVEGWTGSNSNSGVGGSGACCSEMDIWEANSISTAVTPHPCDAPDLAVCSGTGCGGTGASNRYAGPCDPDGCDFNAYRMGNTSFYGPGKTINTNAKFTVVTQFLTNTGTASGILSEIRRFYVQNGRVFAQPKSNVAGISGNSITTGFCNAQKTVFKDQNIFNQHGGMAGMSKGLARGMVLVMSVWDDYAANMQWLDSSRFPATAPTTQPGVARGTCPTTAGKPADVEANSPGASVAFSNIKVGPIGSTY